MGMMRHLPLTVTGPAIDGAQGTDGPVPGRRLKPSERRMIASAARTSTKSPTKSPTTPGASPLDPATSSRPVVRQLLDALNAHGWNREATARALGISRTTLWRRMRDYGLA